MVLSSRYIIVFAWLYKPRVHILSQIFDREVRDDQIRQTEVLFFFFFLDKLKPILNWNNKVSLEK